jgi:hypothetical protein
MTSRFIELAPSATRSLAEAGPKNGRRAEQICDAQQATNGGEERVTQGLSDAPE